MTSIIFTIKITFSHSFLYCLIKVCHIENDCRSLNCCQWIVPVPEQICGEASLTRAIHRCSFVLFAFEYKLIIIISRLRLVALKANILKWNGSWSENVEEFNRWSFVSCVDNGRWRSRRITRKKQVAPKIIIFFRIDSYEKYSRVTYVRIGRYTHISRGRCRIPFRLSFLGHLPG